jgi:hypothetical protein
MLKKGVYMDGHKRPDVVDYWMKTFLLLMAQCEEKMVHWIADGPDLVHVDPKLGPDNKRIIAVFQDESCFHVNEYKSDAWCTPQL